MLETVVLLHIFWGPVIFFLDSLINKKLKKNSIYLKDTFCVTIYNAIQKFGVSTFFLSVFYINTLFRRDVKWIKSHSKDLYSTKSFTGFWLFRFFAGQKLQDTQTGEESRCRTAWSSLNFDKEYLFGFETLVFVTSGIWSLHNQLVTLQRERKAWNRITWPL